jgi:aldose 1-epimerase
MTLQKQPYGRLPDGAAVDSYTLGNSRGLTAKIITYGGILTSLTMADRRGKSANVTLGFDTLEEYPAKSPFFGALVGRFANRITKGAFAIEGRQYQLACNDGPNHLHGGLKGYDKVIWKAKSVQEKRSAAVVLSYTSPDGEEGYPGTLRITVTYRITEENELSIEYSARTDQPTPVNLTQHSYWNLAGAGTVLDHELSLDCPFYLPVDSQLMPTGEILSVRGGPMDFTAPKPIGRDIGKVSGGYDHCWAAARSDRAFKRIAVLYEPSGGRGMEVWTTKPGVQFYSGNFLDGLPGAGGAVYARHAGLCLETEFFPDAVNRPHFPSCILSPGQTYSHRTVHRFFVR